MFINYSLSKGIELRENVENLRLTTLYCEKRLFLERKMVHSNAADRNDSVIMDGDKNVNGSFES